MKKGSAKVCSGITVLLRVLLGRGERACGSVGRFIGHFFCHRTTTPTSAFDLRDMAGGRGPRGAPVGNGFRGGNGKERPNALVVELLHRDNPTLFFKQQLLMLMYPDI